MTDSMKTYRFPYPSKSGQFGMIEVAARSAEEAKRKAIGCIASLDDFDADFVRKVFVDVMDNRKETEDELRSYFDSLP